MTLRTRRLMQQIVIFTITAIMIFAHNSLVTLNARVMTALIAGLAAILITVTVFRRGHRDSALLLSILDYAWLPFILLTGLTIATAQFPRRSLEVWLWQIGIQLPIAYAAFILFRKGWPERGV